MFVSELACAVASEYSSRTSSARIAWLCGFAFKRSRLRSIRFSTALFTSPESLPPLPKMSNRPPWTSLPTPNSTKPPPIRIARVR